MEIFNKHVNEFGDLSTNTELRDFTTEELKFRLHLCVAGSQLRVLQYEDYKYIMSPHTKQPDAQRRLRTRNLSDMYYTNSARQLTRFLKENGIPIEHLEELVSAY